ncbi:MAG: hypothetical protein ACD_41C00253G0002 [uncultured bacterium]|nr:MAG: hypothetical protein ACD_41C00253G0002 [uncultured bacterium]
MGLSDTAIQQVIEELKKPDMVSKDGQFIVLYAHGRWYLMTTMYMGAKGKPDHIRTVHFMDQAGAEYYFHNFMQPPSIQTFDDMFQGFAEEVKLKVLPTAKDYLPLVEAGLLKANTGYTTDTTSVSDIGARGQQFIDGLQKAMDKEVRGFALQFTK